MKWSFSWFIQVLHKKAFRNTKGKKDIGHQVCHTSIFGGINCGSDRGNVVPKVTQPGNVGCIDTQWSEGGGAAQAQPRSTPRSGVKFCRNSMCQSNHAYQELKNLKFNQQANLLIYNENSAKRVPIWVFLKCKYLLTL